MDIKDLIASEIQKRPDRAPDYRQSDLWIRCPFHGNGQENTPSLRIRMTVRDGFDIGDSKCFGCQWKGKWNDIADALKLRKARAADELPSEVGFSFDEEKYILPNLDLMQSWPKTETWRTIEGATLNRLGAKLTMFKGRLTLYLPVIVRGEYVGGIYARLSAKKGLTSSQQKSYTNTPGPWSDVNLYGYDIAVKRKGPLWVVEGPRDTAKIIQLGGRVVGLIGSNVSEEKIALIEALDPPLILTATDPDDAGNRAAKKLHKYLPYIPHERVEFPEGKDPANFTPRSFQAYLERYAHA